MKHRLKTKQMYSTICLCHTSSSSKVKVEQRNKCCIDTVDTHMKEPAFIGTLRLKFHLLNPLTKNPKDAEMGHGSYIRGFMLFYLRIQE